MLLWRPRAPAAAPHATARLPPRPVVRHAMLALLVPRLLDLDAATLAACGALAHVAARARAEVVDGAEAALLRALGIEAAAAPLAALGAGIDVGGDWVARADPVTTHVSHDDVRIVARVDDLRDDEVAALRALLERHFAEDGLAFAAPRRDAWFVRSAVPHALDTVPLGAAVGRPLRSRLPSGADAKRWRRWWTEVQMLLHGQPVAARERAPVHALWFADAGCLPAGVAPALRVFAAPARDGDVLRGLARMAGADVAPPSALRHSLAQASAEASIAACTEPLHDARMLDDFARDVLAPVLDALDRGRIDRLVLVGEGRGAAARWDVGRGGWRERWLPRRAVFAAPPLGDDA